MAPLAPMPAIALDPAKMVAFGAQWAVNGGALSRTPPFSSIQLGDAIDAAVASALATMLGGNPVVKASQRKRHSSTHRNPTVLRLLLSQWSAVFPSRTTTSFTARMACASRSIARRSTMQRALGRTGRTCQRSGDGIRDDPYTLSDGGSCLRGSHPGSSARRVTRPDLVASRWPRCADR